jgi:hypothetical protein
VLHHIGQFMREQALPRRRAGIVQASAKKYICTDRKGFGLERPGQAIGLGVRVNLDTGEITAHAAFEIAAHNLGQQLPRTALGANPGFHAGGRYLLAFRRTIGPLSLGFFVTSLGGLIITGRHHAGDASITDLALDGACNAGALSGSLRLFGALNHAGEALGVRFLGVGCGFVCGAGSPRGFSLHGVFRAMKFCFRFTGRYAVGLL